jgi:hypothetical protein
MKRVSIAITASLAMGLAINWWAFTSHACNPDWLISVQLPGMYLGAWLLTLAGGSFAPVLFFAGVAMQWALQGLLVAVLLHARRIWRLRRTTSLHSTPR